MIFIHKANVHMDTFALVAKMERDYIMVHAQQAKGTCLMYITESHLSEGQSITRELNIKINTNFKYYEAGWFW